MLILGGYAEADMAPFEIIRASRVNAAKPLGMANEVGALEGGEYADIIAIRGDPLRDAMALQHARFVMKGDRVVGRDGPAAP